uniref:Carbonic anhydrase n=1 Tax=Panagrolaimus superbus TaxID=310955 RepID=A0A914Z2Z0_9BILA
MKILVLFVHLVSSNEGSNQTFLILFIHTLFSDESQFGWGYSQSDGPKTWGGKCISGKQQSPINIQQNNANIANYAKLNFINFDTIGSVKIMNNGLTIMASGMQEWNENQPYISGGGLKYNYQLVQFHIHWSQMNENGSEHTIDGKHFPAEIHLLHIKEGQSMNESLHQKDGIAVVSLLVNIRYNSSVLTAFDEVFKTLLLNSYKGGPTVVQQYRPSSILPTNYDSFFYYEGSLTTPGCEESVIWLILTEP